MADTSVPAASSSETSDIPQVSPRDTKADILAAYQELVRRYEGGASQARGKEQDVRRAKEETVLKQASGYTVEKIVAGCGNLETATRTWLRDLSDSLIRESKKLAEIQDAISIKERYLKEVHDITVAAEVLADLIETHRAKEREFEEETRARTAEREREEEARNYALAQKRKKDEDAYKEKREALEKELDRRMQAIAAEEQETKQLRKRAEQFDNELATVGAKAAKEAEERIRKEEKMKADFLAQSVLREKEIAELKIAGLTERLVQSVTEVAALKTQLKAVSAESKEIALKVIEGAATMQNLRRVERGEGA